MSSYQAADIHVSADLAVLTSLGADHVSWHGSLEQYHADKLGPVRAAKHVIGSGDDPLVLELLAELGGGAVTADSARDQDLVNYLRELPGHSATNAMLAVAAAMRITNRPIDPPGPAARLKAQPALVGRLRTVGTRWEKTWIDDALASNPMAAAAALDAFPADTVWLIVGGLDRDVSLGPILAALDRRPANSVHLVSVPDNGPAILAACEAHASVASITQVENVAAAVAFISGRSGSGVVLFSPGAPTPKQHGTWAERAAAFERAVTQLTP